MSGVKIRYLLWAKNRFYHLLFKVQRVIFCKITPLDIAGDWDPFTTKRKLIGKQKTETTKTYETFDN